MGQEEGFIWLAVSVFGLWWLGLLCLGRAMWQKEHVADKVLYFMVDRK